MDIAKILNIFEGNVAASAKFISSMAGPKRKAESLTEEVLMQHYSDPEKDMGNRLVLMDQLDYDTQAQIYSMLDYGIVLLDLEKMIEWGQTKRAVKIGSWYYVKHFRSFDLHDIRDLSKLDLTLWDFENASLLGKWSNLDTFLHSSYLDPYIPIVFRTMITDTVFAFYDNFKDLPPNKIIVPDSYDEKVLQLFLFFKMAKSFQKFPPLVLPNGKYDFDSIPLTTEELEWSLRSHLLTHYIGSTDLSSHFIFFGHHRVELLTWDMTLKRCLEIYKSIVKDIFLKYQDVLLNDENIIPVGVDFPLPRIMMHEIDLKFPPTLEFTNYLNKEDIIFLQVMIDLSLDKELNPGTMSGYGTLQLTVKQRLCLEPFEEKWDSHVIEDIAQRNNVDIALFLKHLIRFREFLNIFINRQKLFTREGLTIGDYMDHLHTLVV